MANFQKIVSYTAIFLFILLMVILGYLMMLAKKILNIPLKLAIVLITGRKMLQLVDV